MCHTISIAMEDLRLWFLETRICRLWPNIVEESWAEFLAEDNRRAKRTLLEFLDSSHNHDILYFPRKQPLETSPKLSPELAKPLHDLVMMMNTHPVR